MKRSVKYIFIIALIISAGCSILDTEDKNAVEAQYHYNDLNDADAAIKGIYGKLMGLIDRVIILNELRADLMDVTSNTTFDMADINHHTATVDNMYCDLKPFYEVILNCNDVLANLKKMNDPGVRKLSDADFAYRYSDVMTARCWVYMQMAIHFGEIPYITKPLSTVNDLKNASADAPKMELMSLLRQLVVEMENLPYKELSTNSPLYVTAGNENLPMFFLNKKIVLGDLYLWTARNPEGYRKAAEQYYSVIEEAEIKLFSSSPQYGYKIHSGTWDEGSQLAAAQNLGFAILYRRHKQLDMNSFRNKWKEMFNLSTISGELSREMITMWSYNPKFKPGYPLYEIFANTGKGKYQLKPSDKIIGLWETQVQRNNGFMFDGRGENSSWGKVNGEPVILKYLYSYYSNVQDANRTIQLQYNAPFEDNQQYGKWFIYRAALLILRYAEAANRAGYWDLAYAMLNNGIVANYNWSRYDGRSRDAQNDALGVRYTGYRPIAPNGDERDEYDKDLDGEEYADRHGTPIPSVPYPRPFYLDARSIQYVMTAPWAEFAGIRGRAYLQNAELPEDNADRTQWMEEALINEAALELAFEGHRWNDLLRITYRKNDEIAGSGTTFLNNVMDAAQKPAMTNGKWFLPYMKVE